MRGRDWFGSKVKKSTRTESPRAWDANKSNEGWKNTPGKSDQTTETHHSCPGQRLSHRHEKQQKQNPKTYLYGYSNFIYWQLRPHKILPCLPKILPTTHAYHTIFIGKNWDRLVFCECSFFPSTIPHPQILYFISFHPGYGGRLLFFSIFSSNIYLLTSLYWQKSLLVLWLMLHSPYTTVHISILFNSCSRSVRVDGQVI